MFDLKLILINRCETLLGSLIIHGEQGDSSGVKWPERHEDRNRSSLTNDLCCLACRQFKARIDQAVASIAEVEYGIRGQLYFALGMCVDASRNSNGSMSVDGTAEIDGVTTHIH